MNHSPEIEHIIEQAISLAKVRRHEYCTIEHLLLSLITYSPFSKVLDDYGVDTETMAKEVGLYLDNQRSIEVPSDLEEEVQPRKTNSLERVMNRSVTQVLEYQ